MKVFVVLLVVNVVCVLCAAAESESFTTPPPICPDEVAIFSCTVYDPNLAITIWKVGNYHPCVLPHQDNEIQKECGPDNAFMASPGSPRGNYYPSTLTATAHPSLNGSRVRCYLPTEQGERTVGEGRLEVIGAPPALFFLPLTESDIGILGESINVTLRWSGPVGYRHTVNITSYHITANWTIPSHGNNSWVVVRGTVGFIRKEFSVVVPIGMVVEFTVCADTCGGELVGNQSMPLVLLVEVPNAVPNCSVTAVYNSSSKYLTDIVIKWHSPQVPYEIAPGLSANVSDYTLSVNNQTVEQKHLCRNEQCSYVMEVRDQETANYSASVAANNVVGQGEAVVCKPALVAHINDLLEVELEVDSHNLSGQVRCQFLSSFQGVASCEIRFTDSTYTHLELPAIQSQGTASVGGNVLIVGIGPLNASTVYFYSVSAVLEDETTPVVVQGSVTTPPNMSGIVLPIWAVVIMVVMSVVVVVVVFIAAVVYFCYKLKRRKTDTSDQHSKVSMTVDRAEDEPEENGNKVAIRVDATRYRSGNNVVRDYDDETDGPQSKALKRKDLGRHHPVTEGTCVRQRRNPHPSDSFH